MEISEIGLYNYLAGKDIDLLEKNVFLKKYKKGEEIYDPSKQYTYVHKIKILYKPLNTAYYRLVYWCF